MKPILFILIFLLSSCNEQGTFDLHDSKNSKINYLISNTFGKDRILLVSSPEKSTSKVQICRLKEHSCIKGTEIFLNKRGVKNQRAIFGTTKFAYQPNGTYRISLTEGQTVLSRDLEILSREPQSGLKPSQNLVVLNEASRSIDLRTLAGSAENLIVDFSAPRCSDCSRLAKLINASLTRIETKRCKIATIVGPNSLSEWKKYEPESISHSYSLQTVPDKPATLDSAVAALELKASARVSTPTIVTVNLKTGKVEKFVGSKSISTRDASGNESLDGFLKPLCEER